MGGVTAVKLEKESFPLKTHGGKILDAKGEKCILNVRIGMVYTLKRHPSAG